MTPQNTPSSKKQGNDFSLKNIDFSKFLDSRNDYNNNSNSYATNDFKHEQHELSFCEPTYLGNTKKEVGVTKYGDNPKVIITKINLYF
jgi:hypothetical protein